MAVTPRRAVVVGSGPNGLAAAITLAEAGVAVTVVEAAEQWGGGLRSAELTLPGVVHDLCATAVPLVPASPFFRRQVAAGLAVELCHAPAVLAHPFDDGTAVVLRRGPECVAEDIRAGDAAWRRRFRPLVAGLDDLVADVLGPLRPPRHWNTTLRFGLPALAPATVVAASFGSPRAAAVFCGLAAHSAADLRRPGTAAIGLVLGALGHAVGWPVVRRGSQSLADAMVARLRHLGGEVVTGRRVDDVDSLDAGGARPIAVLDLVPRDVLRVAGHRLPAGYRRRLAAYRHGPGACKVDLVLSGPIPWRAPGCAEAAVVHLGGSAEEIVASEAAVATGRLAERPFVLLAQPCVADPSRAPEGLTVVWAYCHVPHGSPVDASPAIEAQIERFAPGVRERILARHVMTAVDLEAHDPNLVGGDVAGGAIDVRQLLMRPAPRLDPYATPDPRIVLCSAATPPGGGVHGLCGWHAARSLLRRLEGRHQG